MTELIWEGKYKDGQKVAPLRVKLPFQTVETVNESAKERQNTLDLFSNNMPSEWRNRLIWGDKKYVLPALMDEFAGKVDLIYIDPPFNTGADFSVQMEVNGEGFIKEPSIIEQKAYRDTWGSGLDSYLRWFYDTVVILKEFLKDTGSIFVHLDYHVSHYCKTILDEVFSTSNLRNEIIWQRTNAHGSLDRFGPIHDTIFYYSITGQPKYNDIRIEYKDGYIDTFVDRVDESGTRFMRVPLTAKGTRNGESGLPFKGIDITSKGLHWKYKVSKLEELERQGKIYWPEKTGGMPRLIVYEADLPGMPLQDIWTDIKAIHNMSDERVGYETQKPVALLDRIIKASTNEGDLVLDCFVGSGTTSVAAEKLNRRWIACDLGRFAIHTTRKRLLSIPNVKPFIVQNLGKYERQLWQTVEFGDKAEITQSSYRRFILNLYNAQPVEGYTWLHGLKAGRMVYVGAVDSPVSPSDIGQIAAEFKRATGTGKDAPARNGVDVLGWDFAFELNEVAKQQAAQANINLRFIRIPREVLEKKAVEQGDIRFFELAALSVDKTQKGHAVTLTLTDFVIPQDDVPDDIRKAVTHWEQWIDYWAVDWNNREDTFHNEWQDYRTNKKSDLQKTISHTYDQPGAYIIMVKVIDILGNDTTKSIKVEVR